MATTRRRAQRVFIGNVVRNEHRIGEVRERYGWVITRYAEKYVATCGNAMSMEEANLIALCRRLDAAGQTAN